MNLVNGVALLISGFSALFLLGAAMCSVVWCVGFFGHNQSLRQAAGDFIEMLIDWSLYSFITAVFVWGIFS